MELTKVLEILKIEKLDEADQTELQKYLETAIEIKVNEKVDLLKEETLAKVKEEKTAELDGLFEEYKKEITSKFSSFVDSILEEELEIPENILEFAHKGELYSDLIEQFKVRLGIDEGVIDDEVKNIMKEAKEEIENKTTEINSLISENLDLKNDNKELALKLYVRQTTDGLTESQKSKIIPLLEDLNTKEEIDSKFSYIMENILNEKKEVKEEKKEVKEQACMCPECGKESMITEGTCSTTPCPNCEAKAMEDKKEKKEEKVEEETKNPFASYLGEYAKVLSSKKW